MRTMRRTTTKGRGGRGRPRGAGAVAACLAIGLGLAAWSVEAAAQEPERLMERGRAAGVDVELLQTLRARAEGAGLETAAAARLMAPAVAAAEEGLPSDLLLRKALEGVSKGVPADRVAAVLATLEGALGRAAGVVDPWLARAEVRGAVRPPRGGEADPDAAVRATLVESGGLALAQGLAPEALEELFARIPADLRGRSVSALELGVAVEILPELPVTAGQPRVAARLVLEALSSGFGAAELRELPAALQAAERRGQLPAEAAARGAIGWMRGDLPAAAVLDNLFRGEFPANLPVDLPPGLDEARDRAGRRGPPGG